MKYPVTGGAGFIRSHIVQTLLEQGALMREAIATFQKDFPELGVRLVDNPPRMAIVAMHISWGSGFLLSILRASLQNHG